MSVLETVRKFVDSVNAEVVNGPRGIDYMRKRAIRRVVLEKSFINDGTEDSLTKALLRRYWDTRLEVMTEWLDIAEACGLISMESLKFAFSFRLRVTARYLPRMWDEFLDALAEAVADKAEEEIRKRKPGIDLKNYC